MFPSLGFDEDLRDCSWNCSPGAVTFIRFIEYSDTDDSLVSVTKVACRQYNQFIWCYDRPKADFPTSDEDRVDLSGLNLPDKFDQVSTSNFELLFVFLNELQLYEFDGRGDNGILVTALDSKPLNGKAWYREDEGRSLMVAL